LSYDGGNNVKYDGFLKNRGVEHELNDLRDANIISVALNSCFHKARGEGEGDGQLEGAVSERAIEIPGVASQGQNAT